VTITAEGLAQLETSSASIGANVGAEQSAAELAA
jgi:hypothetical protein